MRFSFLPLPAASFQRHLNFNESRLDTNRFKIRIRTDFEPTAGVCWIRNFPRDLNAIDCQQRYDPAYSKADSIQ